MRSDGAGGAVGRAEYCGGIARRRDQQKKRAQADQFGQLGSFGQGGQSVRRVPNVQSSRKEIAANAALTLIGVACTLLDRQIERLAQDFVGEGGFTERLYRIRSAHRK